MTTPHLRRSPRASEFGFGLLYWLVFLLVLEPGNLMRAADQGAMPPFGSEMLRILGAGLLGASSTPLVMALLCRYPIVGPRLWKHLTVHSFANAMIAFALILASCILAAWLKVGDSRPVWVALPEHVASNWLLLFFCLSTFMVTAHAIRMSRMDATPPANAGMTPRAAEPQVRQQVYAHTVEVRSRGATTLVDLANISWIETQGNYQALHAQNATHLIRETAMQLDARLDPSKFVRTHRRTSVAIDRIREIRSLGNGDAEVRLADGTCVKVSRSCREQVRRAIEGRLHQTSEIHAPAGAVDACD